MLMWVLLFLLLFILLWLILMLAVIQFVVVTAWLPRPGIRTYIFFAGLPTLLSRSTTSYLALYP